MRAGWLIFAARFVVILAVGLCPWPGLSHACTSAYCAALDAVAPWVFSSETAQFHFKPADDPSLGEDVVPWRMYVYAQQPSTGAIDRLWKDERLSYISIVTFLALAAAMAPRHRSARARASRWVVGFAVLLVILVLDDLNLLALTLARWRWTSLSPALAIVLSAAHTLFDGLPSMTYVVPALIWGAVVYWRPVGANKR